MKRLLTVGLCILVLASCKKSTSSTSSAPANPYFPITTNNYWTYTKTDLTTSPASTTNYTVTVLGADSIISSLPGIHYKVLSDTSKKHVYLYRSNADSSFRRGIFANLKGIPDVEEKYYVKNIPVGGSWNDTALATLFNTKVPIVFKHTISSLDTSIAVSGKVYTKVAHVALDLISPPPYNLGRVGGGDFYYAQGIGSIQYSFVVSIPLASININQTERITDYSIK
jgi:hypothetical protein